MRRLRVSKVMVIIVAVLAVSAVSAYMFTTVLADTGNTRQAGEALSEALDDALRSNIVAEINGVPVTASQIELRRFINASNREQFGNPQNAPPGIVSQFDPSDYPVEDDEILNQIAKELYVISAAKEVGISYSDEDILQLIYAEEEYVRGEIERGNEAMIQRQNEDDELLSHLGMTKDEFYESVYIDMLRYSSTIIDYSRYYYTELAPSGEFVSFELFIEDAFNMTVTNIVMLK